MPTNQHNKTSRNPMFENQDKIEYFLRWHLYLLKMNGNNNPVKQELILQKQKLAVRVHGRPRKVCCWDCGSKWRGNARAIAVNAYHAALKGGLLSDSLTGNRKEQPTNQFHRAIHAHSAPEPPSGVPHTPCVTHSNGDGSYGVP